MPEGFFPPPGGADRRRIAPIFRSFLEKEKTKRYFTATRLGVLRIARVTENKQEDDR